jgi:outer membrane protein insertion porin family
VGVRVFLPMLGMLGLDWGWGFDTPPGETERSGSKLQFTLGQSF